MCRKRGSGTYWSAARDVQTVEPLAAITVLPAVPSEVDTLLDSVKVPERPFGAVDTLVGFNAAVMSVYALAPMVTVIGAVLLMDC